MRTKATERATKSQKKVREKGKQEWAKKIERKVKPELCVFLKILICAHAQIKY